MPAVTRRRLVKQERAHAPILQLYLLYCSKRTWLLRLVRAAERQDSAAYKPSHVHAAVPGENRLPLTDEVYDLTRGEIAR